MPQVVAGVIGLALFNLGLPLGLVNLAVAATPFLFNAAISVGLSLGASALMRLGATPQQAPSVKPSDGQQAIRQAIPARRRSYGRLRLSGPVFWYDVEPAQGHLYLGVVLNQGRISAFVGYHIDDKEVTIDGSGNVTTSPYSGVTTRILTRLGATPETKYSEINAAFSVDEVRLDGCASMLLIADNFATAETQIANYPNNVPRFRVTIDASVVWDPRDSAQDREDESSWRWSENPIVCLLDYLLSPDGYAIPFDAIEGNLAEWKAAMDICDEPVLSIDAGGYEPRYRMAGTFLYTDKPATVLSRFMSTCDARLWQKRDGTLGIAVGRFVPPAVTLDDRHIIDYDLTRGQDPLNAVAGVRAQYLSPDHDYIEQDADPWPDGETVMALGEDRVATLDFLWVPSHSQARRLMKRAALREQAAWRGTIRTTLAGLRAIDERYIKLTIAELQIERSFEVSSWKLDPGSMQCVMEVLAVDASIDDWDPATEEGTPASQPILTAWTGPSLTSAAASTGVRAVRQVIDPTASGGQVRLSFGGHPTQGVELSHVTIMTRSGATANGTATPVEVTFGSPGATAVSAAAGVVITSDWVDFDVVAGTDLLVHMEYYTSGQEVRVNDASASRYTSTTLGEYLSATMTVFAGPGAQVHNIVKVEVRAGA